MPALMAGENRSRNQIQITCATTHEDGSAQKLREYAQYG